MELYGSHSFAAQLNIPYRTLQLNIPYRTLMYWVETGLIRPHTYSGRRRIPVKFSDKDVKEIGGLAQLRQHLRDQQLRDVLDLNSPPRGLSRAGHWVFVSTMGVGSNDGARAYVANRLGEAVAMIRLKQGFPAAVDRDFSCFSCHDQTHTDGKRWGVPSTPFTSKNVILMSVQGAHGITFNISPQDINDPAAFVQSIE